MNARSQPLTLAVLALAMVGLGIAVYLTYVHYNHDALICTTGGCETVQQSEYSTIAGIPVALLGVGMFTAVGLLAISRLTGNKFVPLDIATIISWLMVFAGIMYYAYLTYIELFVLEAICQWCVASSVVTLAILAIESVQVWRVLDSDDEDDVHVPTTTRPARRRS